MSGSEDFKISSVVSIEPVGFDDAVRVMLRTLNGFVDASNKALASIPDTVAAAMERAAGEALRVRTARDTAAKVERMRREMDQRETAITKSGVDQRIQQILREKDEMEKSIMELVEDRKEAERLMVKNAKIAEQEITAIRKGEAERQSQEGQANSGRNLGAIGMAAGAGAAVLGITAAQSDQVAEEFDANMRNVNSIAKMTEEQLGATSQAVIDMTKSIPKSAADLSAGLYDIQSSGFAGEDAMTILEVSAKGATAGLSSTAESVRALTGVMNAYNQKTGADANYIMDVLFQTVNKGVITFPQLAQNLGDVTSLAAAAHVPIDQLGGAIAQMTVKGVPAAQAFTALNGTIQKIMVPSEQASKFAKQLGLDWFTAGKSGEHLAKVGLPKVMQEIATATKGDPAAMKKLIEDIEAHKGAMILAAGAGKEYAKTMLDFKNVAGATQGALDEQMKSMKAQRELMQNSFDAARISMGKGAFSVMLPLMKLTNLILAGFNGLAEPIKRVAGAFTFISAGVLASVAAMTGLSLSFSAVIANVPMVTAGLVRLGVVAAGTTPTLAAMGTAIWGALAPLLPMIGAVAAAAAILYGAWELNFAGIRDLVNGVTAEMQVAWQVFSTWFSDESVKMGTTTASAWEAMMYAIAGVLTILEEIVKGSLGVISEVFTVFFIGVQEGWSGLGTYIQQSWGQAFSGLISITNTAMSRLHKVIMDAGNQIAKMLAGIVRLITDPSKAGFEGGMAEFKAGWAGFGAAATDGLNVAKDATKKAVDEFNDGVSKGMEYMVGKTQEMRARLHGIGSGSPTGKKSPTGKRTPMGAVTPSSIPGKADKGADKAAQDALKAAQEALQQRAKMEQEAYDREVAMRKARLGSLASYYNFEKQLGVRTQADLISALSDVKSQEIALEEEAALKRLEIQKKLQEGILAAALKGGKATANAAKDARREIQAINDQAVTVRNDAEIKRNQNQQETEQSKVLEAKRIADAEKSIHRELLNSERDSLAKRLELHRLSYDEKLQKARENGIKTTEIEQEAANEERKLRDAYAAEMTGKLTGMLDGVRGTFQALVSDSGNAWDKMSVMTSAFVGTFEKQIGKRMGSAVEKLSKKIDDEMVPALWGGIEAMGEFLATNPVGWAMGAAIAIGGLAVALANLSEANRKYYKEHLRFRQETSRIERGATDDPMVLLDLKRDAEEAETADKLEELNKRKADQKAFMDAHTKDAHLYAETDKMIMNQIMEEEDRINAERIAKQHEFMNEYLQIERQRADKVMEMTVQIAESTRDPGTIREVRFLADKAKAQQEMEDDVKSGVDPQVAVDMFGAKMKAAIQKREAEQREEEEKHHLDLVKIAEDAEEEKSKIVRERIEKELALNEITKEQYTNRLAAIESAEAKSEAEREMRTAEFYNDQLTNWDLTEDERVEIANKANASIMKAQDALSKGLKRSMDSAREAIDARYQKEEEELQQLRDHMERNKRDELEAHEKTMRQHEDEIRAEQDQLDIVTRRIDAKRRAAEDESRQFKKQDKAKWEKLVSEAELGANDPESMARLKDLKDKIKLAEGSKDYGMADIYRKELYDINQLTYAAMETMEKDAQNRLELEQITATEYAEIIAKSSAKKAKLAMIELNDDKVTADEKVRINAIVAESYRAFQDSQIAAIDDRLVRQNEEDEALKRSQEERVRNLDLVKMETQKQIDQINRNYDETFRILDKKIDANKAKWDKALLDLKLVFDGQMIGIVNAWNPLEQKLDSIIAKIGRASSSQFGGGPSYRGITVAQMFGVPHAASGGKIAGGTPGKDSVLVNTMPGELIVDNPITKGLEQVVPWLQGLMRTNIATIPSTSQQSYSSNRIENYITNKVEFTGDVNVRTEEDMDRIKDYVTEHLARDGV